VGRGRRAIPTYGAFTFVGAVETGGGPTRRCPHTGLTIPECSCPRCLEEQLRRFQPALLRKKVRRGARRRPAQRRRPRRLAAWPTGDCL